MKREVEKELIVIRGDAEGDREEGETKRERKRENLEIVF